MASDTVIENPIINTPFTEPTRHFEFDHEGITDRTVDGRRVSSYFMPIAKPKARQAALPLDELTTDQIRENTVINRIRDEVMQVYDLRQ